eukprot:m.82988 g.82988  ORF g.82988 m.82988 type:complete len:639 (+) comp14326_c2_seq1:555-2471(+)
MSQTASPGPAFSSPPSARSAKPPRPRSTSAAHRQRRISRLASLPQVGDLVMSLDGSRRGVARFIGETHFKSGTWIGIELEPGLEGKNDGQVDDKRYFTCEAGRGIFLPVQRVQVLQRASGGTEPVVDLGALASAHRLLREARETHEKEVEALVADRDKLKEQVDFLHERLRETDSSSASSLLLSTPPHAVNGDSSHTPALRSRSNTSTSIGSSRSRSNTGNSHLAPSHLLPQTSHHQHQHPQERYRSSSQERSPSTSPGSRRSSRHHQYQPSADGSVPISPQHSTSSSASDKYRHASAESEALKQQLAELRGQIQASEALVHTKDALLAQKEEKILELQAALACAQLEARTSRERAEKMEATHQELQSTVARLEGQAQARLGEEHAALLSKISEQLEQLSSKSSQQLEQTTVASGNDSAAKLEANEATASETSLAYANQAHEDATSVRTVLETVSQMQHALAAALHDLQNDVRTRLGSEHDLSALTSPSGLTHLQHQGAAHHVQPAHIPAEDAQSTNGPEHRTQEEVGHEDEALHDGLSLLDVTSPTLQEMLSLHSQHIESVHQLLTQLESSASSEDMCRAGKQVESTVQDLLRNVIQRVTRCEDAVDVLFSQRVHHQVQARPSLPVTAFESDDEDVF